MPAATKKKRTGRGGRGGGGVGVVEATTLMSPPTMLTALVTNVPHYTVAQLGWLLERPLEQLTAAKLERAHIIASIRRPLPLRRRRRPLLKPPTTGWGPRHVGPVPLDDDGVGLELGAAPSTAPLKCPQCIIYDLKIDGHQWRCTYCGLIRFRENISLVAMTYGEHPIYNQGDYFRLSHLKDILRGRVPSIMQAKNQDISLDNLYRVCTLLYTDPQLQLRSSCDISLQAVRAAAKQLNIKNKNTIIYLTELLSGVARPVYSMYDMNVFTCVFQALQLPYELKRDKRRTNFLHYDSTAFAIMQLLGLDHWLYCYFFSMKGALKLKEFNKIWGDICADHRLNWGYYPILALPEARAALG